MIPAPTLANFGLYVLQAALLIGALALTLAALRPGPALRLAACRGLLAVLLLLPLQVWLREAPALEALPPLSPHEAVTAVDAIVVHGIRGLPWPTLVAGAIAVGIVARLLWLVAGLVRLRRLARELPEPLPAGVEHEVAALQAALGTRARVVFVERMTQPVTFGIAPAIVLLPAPLLVAPVERRRAILCHELLHVRRRDWIWVLGEELSLTILWFHPAAWWLVGELQLAREQVVDALTVASTGARREYMDALFSAADLPSAPPLLSGFLRRRHLARRLISLAEEVVMSRLRLVVGGVSIVAVLLGSGAAGLAAWPMTPVPSAVQEPVKMAFKTRDDQAVRIVHRVAVPYPTVAVAGVFGELVVDVDAAVDSTGAVTATKAATVTVHGRSDGAEGVSATTTPAIEAAVASAVDAIREWRFEAPPQTPASVLVRVRFADETREAMVTGVTPVRGYLPKPVLRVRQSPRKIVNVQPVYPKEAQDAKITGIVVLEVVVDETGSVKEAWVSKSVPMLDEAALDAVKQWKYETTLLNGVPVPVQITCTVSFTLAAVEPDGR